MFPSDADLQVTAEAAFGADLTQDPATWTFTDLSDRVVTSNPVTVTRGAIVGASTKKGGGGSVTALNDDGALSIDHPGSPWWPYVDQGTPIRLSVAPPQVTYLTDAFGRTVSPGWGTPDYRIPPGAGWLSTNANLTVSSGQARIAHSGVNELLSNRIFFRHTDVEATYTTTISAVTTAAPVGIGPTLRGDSTSANHMWALMEYVPGGTVRWVAWRRVAGSYIGGLGPYTQPGLTYTAGAAVKVRLRYAGRRLQARAWLAAGSEPSTWAMDVSDDFLLDGGRYFGFQSWRESGNTNTTPIVTTVDDLSVVSAPLSSRVEGYIADIKPRFVPLGDGGTHSVVQVDIGGVATRLEKRTADAMSPISRSMLKNPADPPIAHWPGEDKAQSTVAASAFPGQPPMTVTGPAVFSFNLGEQDDEYISRYGTSAFVSVAAGAKLSAPVPISATGEWTVSVLMQANAAAVPLTSMRTLEWQTAGGTHNRWALISTNTPGHIVRAYNDGAGTSTDVITFADGFNTIFVHSVSADQNGANIDVKLVFAGGVQATGSVAGTLGAVSRVVVNPDQANTTASTDPFGIRFAVSQVVVHDAVVAGLPFYNDAGTGEQPRADRAWANEALHRRAGRLCDEERIPFRVVGDPYTSGVTMLGPQPAGTFSDLITATVESGSGDLLIEDGFGYTLLTRGERYNRETDLTVDMSTYARSGGTDPGDVLQPVLGRAGANAWTVERRNGSSASYAAPEEYRNRRGTISDKVTLDILGDSDCAGHARWRTHLSVDGTGGNYPAFEVDLAANPSLIDAWRRTAIGSRAQWTNQPAIAGTGTIDQVIEGISETFSHSQSSGGRSWTAKLDTSPASVWDVGVYDDAGTRRDSTSTTLGVARNAVQASWTFSTANTVETWSTASGDYPLDLNCGGEQITVTAMGAVSGSGPCLQTATVTRSVNGISKAQAAGTSITLWRPAVRGL